MASSRKQTLRYDFQVSKDAKTKGIMERNKYSGPLLRLPGELRNHIWGYVLGFQLVHVMKERPQQNLSSPNLRFFHTICESPVTEMQAYVLSRDESYENVVKHNSTTSPVRDMRHCNHRHADCYEALRAGPTKRLHIDLLSVCRQTYSESIRCLWGTNTWSINDTQTLRGWLRHRNTVQRSLMKKLHLGNDTVLLSLPRAISLSFDTVEHHYIDITTDSGEWRWRHPYFCSKRFFVICSGTGEYANHYQYLPRDKILDDNGSTSVKERIEKADRWCARLIGWGDTAKYVKLALQKKRALRSATAAGNIQNDQSNRNLNQQEQNRRRRRFSTDSDGWAWGQI